jgi:Terpene synthase family 2, C-terminal metal binding
VSSSDYPNITSDRIPESFRARIVTTAKPKTFRRFLEHCDAYIESVVREAGLRDHGDVLELEEYIRLRRENSAVRVCFGMISYILGVDLPDEVFEDPTFQKIYYSAVDMVCWANVSKRCVLTNR